MAVDNDGKAGILSSDRFLDDQAQMLIDAAFDEGAADDVTAVLARYEIRNGRQAVP